VEQDMARKKDREPAKLDEKPGIPAEDPSWGDEGGGGQYPGGPTSRGPDTQSDAAPEADDPTVGPQS
jgi:hypothetical protein